ncbi:DUF3857 domain-containing protein [Marinifilum caeruleilacunae]|uniref:DUF3857 domain-containing protein n=1 Tax=Marinifilum caeruleilacunae TaxID=2499076 RepID=A0ABX1WXU7_9BACT|nr:DUF3857 domain-containing protein [Marinifilum caeruleilacunae]NOU60680.1 DUF3857 domain-containing protein [Marinifilum caeruleilacunae]
MKLHYFYFLIAALLFSTNLSAKKTPMYPVSDIPEELKEGANAVIRLDRTNIKINSIYDIDYRHETAITILNESGDSYADVMVGYSKTISLSNLQIALYDAQGALIERIKNHEINDYSASGESMFSDDRVKHYEPIQKNYPYTIVYSYTQKLNEYTTIAGWYPYAGSKCSVQKSSYTISSANPELFKYKMYNSDQKPIIRKASGITNYSWEANDLKAYKYEPYASPYSLRGPFLRVAPTTFQYDKINGSTASWNDLAKWFSKLNEGRDVLDENTIAEVKNMVKDCPTDFEKVKKLYEYMQNKTRYVSIQVGLGSQQPFPAQYVQDKSYGDCKALSNYMKSILKIVEIPSYYTIITSANKQRDLDTTFVRNFGNHIVLMVPMQKDTVWLECTSKFSPCGFLGSSTDDRTVLAINENGGKLVRTSVYKMEDNTQEKRGEIIVKADGTAEAHITEVCRGLQYSYLAGMSHLSPEDQKKKIYSDLELPDFKIKSHAVSKELTRIPSSTLELDLDIRNYASKSGDRLFIPLNLINRRSNVPKKVKNRETDIYYKREYCDTDTIHFSLPEGYEMESIPEKKVIESDFGSYTSEAIKDGNKVTYIRKMVYKKFEYPAERYDELRTYIKAVVRADKAKLVLKRKV